MNRADDGTILAGKISQQPYAVGCRHLVQTAGRFVQKEDGRIGNHLERDRESLPFAAAQSLGRHIAPMVQVQAGQYLRDRFLAVRLVLDLKLACYRHQLLDRQHRLMVIFLGDVARRLLVQVYRALDTGFTVVVCWVKFINETKSKQNKN